MTADDKALTATQDIFGRDRFGSDRGDMGGIGTFSRENRTLYAGRVPTDRQGRDLEEAARRQFGEFGAIDYVRVSRLPRATRSQILMHRRSCYTMVRQTLVHRLSICAGRSSQIGTSNMKKIKITQT